jgi:hypothetical protein
MDRIWVVTPRFLENVFLDISIDPEGKRAIVCKLVRSWRSSRSRIQRKSPAATIQMRDAKVRLEIKLEKKAPQFSTEGRHGNAVSPLVHPNDDDRHVVGLFG